MARLARSLRGVALPCRNGLLWLAIGGRDMRALVGAVLGLICVAEFSADGFAQTPPTNKPGRRTLTIEELTKPLDIASPPGLPPPEKPSSAKPVDTDHQAPTTPSVDWRLTRWHMTSEQVASISPYIAPTSAKEKRDLGNPHVGEVLLCHLG